MNATTTTNFHQDKFENAIAALLVGLARLSQDKLARAQDTKRK
jgi:hypothetical protein